MPINSLAASELSIVAAAARAAVASTAARCERAEEGFIALTGRGRRKGEEAGREGGSGNESRGLKGDE